MIQFIRANSAQGIPLADESVQCVVTSPPYWGLRDYGVAGQLGCEPTYVEYLARMVAVFEEVRRVLRRDGVLWLNIGDCYAGGGNGGGGSFANDGIRSAKPGTDKNVPARKGDRGCHAGLKAKDLMGLPWRVAFALQAAGWYLRNDNIWHKPNPMPESVTDRCPRAHEYIFHLTKSERYYFDAAAIAEASGERGGDYANFARASKEGAVPGQPLRQHRLDRKPTANTGQRNKRSVWTIPTQPTPEAHFATFPEKLVEPCILAGCPVGGVVLDPFSGSGTTVKVAERLGRRGLGLELNPVYIEIARRRCGQRYFFAEGAA